MNSGKRLHHIADDHQRGVLVRIAVDKGMKQTRGEFMYTVLTEELDDEDLMVVRMKCEIPSRDMSNLTAMGLSPPHAAACSGVR